MRPPQATLLILLAQIVALAVGAYDYCKFPCTPSSVKHTVCKTHCKKLSNSRLIPQTFEFRKKMVAEHNKLRQVIAKGENTTGGNSKASNMMVMSYDLELEFTMSCWLVTLEMIQHDKCRGTEEFHMAGQNLFYSTWRPSMGPPDGDNIIHEFMSGYFGEITMMTAEQVDKFDGGSMQPGKMIGHYTQMVWASNAFLGCAITLVNHTKEQRVLQGCNFGPGGNLLGAKVYERGDPVTKCPKGLKANSEYPGLCGKIRPYEARAHKPGNPGMYALWGISRGAFGVLQSANLVVGGVLFCLLLFLSV